MYAFVIILYIGGISLFIKSVWQTIQKGGPMHEVFSHAIALPLSLHPVLCSRVLYLSL